MGPSLDFQWGKRFEQREPPTEDMVIQVNLGSQNHPKPIFISESLSLMKKEELIILVKEYCNPLIPDVRITVSKLDTTYKIDLTFLIVRLNRF